MTVKHLLAICLVGSLVTGGCPAKKEPPPPTAVAPSERPAIQSGSDAPKFTDITETAGLSFRQYHGGCGTRYFIEQVASGATFIDANNDGFLNLYFPQGKPLGKCTFPEKLTQRLYINDGKGGYKLAPAAFGGKETDYGVAAAVGDYDNDGKEDLFVACSGTCVLYRGKGDGTFEDVTAKAGVGAKGFCTGAVWFDYDGDGKLDLYVLRYCEWTVESDIPCMNKDGKPDVCDPTTYTASFNTLYRNNGNGTFTDVTAKAGVGKERRRSLGVAAADFDGDGKIDLLVANDLGPNSLFLNKGDGTFEDVGMQRGVALGLTGNPQANMGVAVGDYNDTGRLSIVITTFANEPFTLYRNDGEYFTDVSGASGVAKTTLPYLGFGAGFFDSRNNGRLDLFFANGHVSPAAKNSTGEPAYKQPNVLMLNDGQGKFVDAPNALPKDDIRVHRGAIFGDVNNDGKIDVLTTASDDRPTLMRNDSAASNWLMVKLTNRFGCATPFGAKVTATIGGKKRLRVLIGAGSYAGDSDHRVHFGLGTADSIEKLEIAWPGGKVQTLDNVKANQVLRVTEAK